MTELEHADFDAFMREVTGFDPFPWQGRLLRRVLDTGWPRLLDLPTGTGKTSALLVALYALALAPERSARRIALVVDRRIIVDQVDEFARKVREALGDPARPVCAKVAASLRALSSSGEAVRVVHLRGGIPRDDSWVSAPDQPTIIASTVDQVGSRLLFRGYGVSESMRPIHAGILARDTLYFLDEVHLATAFEATLDELENRYSTWSERDVGRHFQIVRMSATPRSEVQDVFGLEDDDRAHPLLSKRLNVRRCATLEQVKTKQGSHAEVQASNRAALAAAACVRARAAATGGAKAIGVVVNRVDTARRIAATLRQHDGEAVLLVTGRMRPFERTQVQEKLGHTAASGVEHSPDAKPTFVVATSCIEAGADLDFDALITEAASLDALRQRFGRLNRLGNHAAAPAWVLGCSDQLGAKATPDWVYGPALRNTWAYLERIAQTQGKASVVDFGLSAFVEPGEDRESLLPELQEAPVLFPSYLDMWSETRPAPHPDPDPSLWLHGKTAKPDRDVSVVFRADVPKQVDASLRAIVAESLEFLPPVSDEAVSVPLHELEAWLAEDVMAWRWSAEGVEAIAVGDLRPGDTVVVGASRGGLGLGTWDPKATMPVDDVAEPATFAVRKLAKLRVDPSTLPEELREGLPKPTDSDEPDEIETSRQACQSWLDGLADRLDDAPSSWHDLLRALAKSDAKQRMLVSADSAAGGRVWRVTVVPRTRAIEATTEDDVSVFTGVEVTLAQHLDDVEAWAGTFARSAGLDRELARDVALAGLLHDLGKADLRFQALLRGGDSIGAAGSEPLAKSRQFGSWIARQRAQLRSGWPGLRHELISLALLDASPELQARAVDLELVRHLVASHHGWCRPWAPATVDPEPTMVRFEVAGIRTEVSTAALDDALSNECASRFRRLCRRYGWHGLAYLEALLRLGDHRASHRPGTRPKGKS